MTDPHQAGPDPASEAERAEEMHRLRMWAGHQPSGPPADPIHVVACRLHGSPPGVRLFALCRWSLATRLVADAAAAGADHAEDLGGDALMLCQAANRGDFGIGELVVVGVADGNRWLRWNPPSPVEPVPGTPGAAAQAN